MRVKRFQTRPEKKPSGHLELPDLVQNALGSRLSEYVLPLRSLVGSGLY
jgi:hypothetical protein